MKCLKFEGLVSRLCKIIFRKLFLSQSFNTRDLEETSIFSHIGFFFTRFDKKVPGLVLFTWYFSPTWYLKLVLFWNTWYFETWYFSKKTKNLVLWNLVLFRKDKKPGKRKPGTIQNLVHKPLYIKSVVYMQIQVWSCI